MGLQLNSGCLSLTHTGCLKTVQCTNACTCCSLYWTYFLHYPDAFLDFGDGTFGSIAPVPYDPDPEGKGVIGLITHNCNDPSGVTLTRDGSRWHLHRPVITDVGPSLDFYSTDAGMECPPVGAVGIWNGAAPTPEYLLLIAGCCDDNDANREDGFADSESRYYAYIGITDTIAVSGIIGRTLMPGEVILGSDRVTDAPLYTPWDGKLYRIDGYYETDGTADVETNWINNMPISILRVDGKYANYSDIAAIRYFYGLNPARIYKWKFNIHGESPEGYFEAYHELGYGKYCGRWHGTYGLLVYPTDGSAIAGIPTANILRFPLTVEIGVAP